MPEIVKSSTVDGVKKGNAARADFSAVDCRSDVLINITQLVVHAEWDGASCYFVGFIKLQFSSVRFAVSKLLPTVKVC